MPDDQALRDLYATIDARIAMAVPRDVITLRRGTITGVDTDGRTVMVQLEGGSGSLPVPYPALPVQPSIGMEAVCAVGPDGWMSLAWVQGGPEVVNEFGQISTSLTPDAAAPRTTAFIAARYAADTGGPALILDKSRVDVVGDHAAMQSGDGIGAVVMRGSTGAAFANANQIVSKAAGTWSTTSTPSDLSITGVASGSTTLQEIVVFDGDGGIRFPAAQIANTDVNALDDYQEGTWTPSITFTTPGNLSVVYTAFRTGRYTKIGRLVLYDAVVATSTFTHTTASGAFRLTGLPFTSAIDNQDGVCSLQGYTAAGYTSIAVETTAGQSYLQFVATGSAQTAVYLLAVNMPTGGTVALRVAGHYEA